MTIPLDPVTKTVVGAVDPLKELENKLPTPTTPISTEATPATTPTRTPYDDLTAEETKRMLAVQADTIRRNATKMQAEEARAAKLEERMAAMEKKPEPTSAQSATGFFQDPVNVMKDLIKKELGDTIKPANDFIAEQKAVSNLAKAKAEFMSDPMVPQQLKALLDGGTTEGYVNQTLKGATDQASLFSALLGVQGAISTGILPAPTGARPMPSTPATTPYVSPSAPPGRGTGIPDAPAIVPLDENEARLARAAGLTPEQFRAAQSSGPLVTGVK